MFRPLIGVLCALVVSLLPHHPAQAVDRLCFREVPSCIEAPFLSFWLKNGGLATFGYPLAEARVEQTPDGTFLAQPFERQRLEHHPELPPAYRVSLGRMGAELLARSGRPWDAFPRVPTDTEMYPSTGRRCQRFQPTGFEVCEPFITAWRSGGLELDGLPGRSYAEQVALWGLPISPPLWETNSSGDRVIAQWFERARFEWHQDNAGTPFEVLYGRLGAELAVEQARPDGTIVRGAALWEYRGGALTPWTPQGTSYNSPWAPWALWEHWDAALVAADLDRAAMMGNVVRVALPWRNFRSSAPESAVVRERFAEFVELARARGLRVIPILFDEFCKYGKPDGWGCWDDWRWDAETAELAGALPGRFRGDPAIAFWEITNEPAWVSPGEWSWQAHRADRIGWLQDAAAAIRAADPYHPLIVGTSLPEEARHVVAAGVSEVSVLHFYPEIHPGRGSLEAELAGLARIQLPLFISEAGRSSSAERGGSEAAQAEFVCQLRAAAATHRAGTLWWHLRAWDDQGWEAQLGLFHPQGHPKLAAQYFAGWRAC